MNEVINEVVKMSLDPWVIEAEQKAKKLFFQCCEEGRVLIWRIGDGIESYLVVAECHYRSLQLCKWYYCYMPEAFPAFYRRNK